MTLVKEITLPWPSGALRSNARAHWAQKHRETAKARELARMLAMEAPRITCEPRATLFIEYYPPSRRGDIHNVPASLKAYIDGIADAMGCDDRQFTVDYPSQWAGTGKPGKVVFRVMAPTEGMPA